MDPRKQKKINDIRLPDRMYTIQNNACCFLAGDRRPRKTAGNGLLGHVQELLKRHGKFYYLLLNIFAPVMPSRQYRRRLESILARYDEDAIILNLGSGPHCLGGRTDVINVDLYAFDPVDMVSDATNLPVRDDSVDLIINTAMMEHIEKPEEIVREMHRVLKQNGAFICYLPFIQPFHAAPNDFRRWTFQGLNSFFAVFNNLETGIGAGPTSGMLWVVQEWLAIAFSLGNRKIHDLLFMGLMIITAPIKLMDMLLVHFPHAEKIASSFYITGEK